MATKKSSWGDVMRGQVGVVQKRLLTFQRDAEKALKDLAVRGRKSRKELEQLVAKIREERAARQPRGERQGGSKEAARRGGFASGRAPDQGRAVRGGGFAQPGRRALARGPTARREARRTGQKSLSTAEASSAFATIFAYEIG